MGIRSNEGKVDSEDLSGQIGLNPVEAVSCQRKASLPNRCIRVGGTYGQISDWQVANHLFTLRGEPKVVDKAGTKANLTVILKILIRLVSVILPNILGVVP